MEKEELQKLETPAIKSNLKKTTTMFWLLLILSLILGGFMTRDWLRSSEFDIIMVMPLLTGITAILEYIKIKKYRKTLKQRNGK